MSTLRQSQRTRGFARPSAYLLLPFLVFHLGFITPIVEWVCLCPTDEPEFSCCCNCPKCVDRRGGFLSYCNLHPHSVGETTDADFVVSGTDLGKEATGAHGRPEFSLETLHCTTQGYIKKISVDFKPFIPKIAFVPLFPLPIAAVFPGENGLPPAVFPQQRDQPG